MKICIFTVSLNTKITGIDVVAVGLANELVSKGHEVVFLTHPGQGVPDRLILNSSIKKYEIHRNYSDKNIKLARSIFLRECPDVVLPMITNSIVSVLVAALHGLEIPLLISEHNNPEKYLNMWWKLGQNYNEKLEIRNAIFGAADRIHLLNESFKDGLPEFLRDRSFVLKNACPVTVSSRSNIEANNIVCVGRLEQNQKNIKLLIESFAQVATKYPDWTLTIVGDGPNKSYYTNLVNSLGIKNKVEFTGHVDNAEEYYLKASIFSIPSYFEGCPMTLIEAQSFGLPAIGLDSCSGVNEMICDGVDGLLVAKDEYADGLESLVKSTDLRIRMSKNAMISAKRYEPSSIYNAWETEIFATINEYKERGQVRLSEINTISESDISKVLLLRFIKENIFWRTYPRINCSSERRRYQKVLESTSWRITAPIRLTRRSIDYLKTNGILASISKAASVLRSRFIFNPKVIKFLGRCLPRIDVVGVDINNMNDVEELVKHLVNKKNVIKNTTTSFCDYLKLARARVIVSAAGAFKNEYTNQATWVEVWHAAGAVKFFSNRTYKNISNRHYIFAPSEYMRREYAKSFTTSLDNVYAWGAIKTDRCFNALEIEAAKKEFYRSYPELKGKKIYLYAPTYRGKWPDNVHLNLELNFEELARQLTPDEVLVTKLHPAIKVDSSLEAVHKSNIYEIPGKIFDFSDDDIFNLISASDVVITDYSSVVYEAALMKKPLVFYAEDVELYDLERGLAFDYRVEIPGQIIDQPDESLLLSSIREAKVDKEKNAIFIEKFLGACDGKSIIRLNQLVQQILSKGIKEPVSTDHLPSVNT